MTRPGVEVISRAQPVPRSAPTDTGAAFMVGSTQKGAGYKLVRSMTDYVNEFGDRTGGTAAYDAAEAFFREGGSKLTVSRTNAGTATTQAKTKSDDAPELRAVDAGVAAALNRLNADLGPGQVFIADATLGAVKDNQSALLAHAANANRIALLSAADGTATAIATAAGAVRTDTNARYGAMFAPSATIPGIAGGTTRSVPYPAIEAGIIARNDVGLNPNVAAAGVNGASLYALDLAARYTDAEYETLNEAGADMARLIYGGVETYGYRTLVDPAGPEMTWLSLGNARLNMAIVAQADVIGERYVFAQIDGRRRKVSQFGGELSAMLVPFYEGGALYGDTPDDAFSVNVGEQVNSDETLAAGELHAVLAVRMSPFSELVVIEIVKVATTEAIAA